MSKLANFPITQRFPSMDTSLIQLYSFPTPNGVKVSIALEELELGYEPHLIDINNDDQKTSEFLSLNPNGKIPAIIDPSGPGGNPIGLFESGAILVYLAQKTGNLIPEDEYERYHCLQWLFFQMAGVGPMFGQFGHFFKFAKDKVKDPYPTERYANETRRLLEVLDGRLANGPNIMGEKYTIADIATFPWVRTVRDFYEGGDKVGLSGFKNVKNWLERCLGRPATVRGLKVPSKPDE